MATKSTYANMINEKIKPVKKPFKDVPPGQKGFQSLFSKLIKKG